MDVTIGQLLDNKYRIVRLLGEGGMGAVYEGENVRIRHRVAIKVLHAGVAMHSDAVQRFEREAQAAGQIGSEHIVEVYDLGELEGGARYIVMEYLEGESLSQRVARLGRMPPTEIAPIMLQLLEGLAAAHDAKIVHRDLKPDNIFLQRNRNGKDFVKIVDFGISKFSVLGGSEMNMTRTGAVMGTPSYMSPEQARGTKNSDHRSDLYSAGVVLFECTTGQVPFRGDSFNDLMFKIALEAPPDPADLVQGLDARFAAIIRTGMAREVAQRFQSASDFAQAILQWMRAMGLRSPEQSVFLGTLASMALSDRPPAPPTMTTPPNAAATPPPTREPSGGTAIVAGGVTPGGLTPNPAGTGGIPSTGTVGTGTAGSLNVVSVGSQTPARSRGGTLAVLGAAIIVVAVGCVFLAMKLLKPTVTVAGETTSTTASAAPAGTPPATASNTAPAPSAAVADTASAAPSVAVAAPPAATNNVPVASPPEPEAGSSPTPATATRRSNGHRSGDSGAPSAESAATTTQVKGRTIRTDL
jgi:serine/threonine protein kinase